MSPGASCADCIDHRVILVRKNRAQIEFETLIRDVTDDGRKLVAKSRTEQPSGRISIVIEEIIDLGKVPPPALTAPRPMVICSGNPRSRAKIAAARARSSSLEIRKSASAGISDVDSFR